MSAAGKTPRSRLPSEQLDARLFLAAEFVQNGLRDSSGVLFPTYFANSEKLSMGLGVYAQVIPAWLFGRSVLLTHATAARIALSGTLAAGLTLTADVRNLGLNSQGFADGLRPAGYEAEFRNRGADPVLDIVFDPPPGLISRVVIEIEDLDAPPATSVALGELALR